MSKLSQPILLENKKKSADAANSDILEHLLCNDANPDEGSEYSHQVKTQNSVTYVTFNSQESENLKTP